MREFDTVVGFTHFRLQDDDIRYGPEFRLVLMKQPHLNDEDVLINPKTEDDLRNTIICAKNIISWAEEQLNKRAMDEAVASSGK